MRDLRIFKQPSFDLSQNLVIGEIICLDYQSLILSIGHFLKDPSIVEDFKRFIHPKNGDASKFGCDFSLSDTVIPKIYSLITEHFGNKIDRKILYLKSNIRTVVDEVVLFLSKIKLSAVEDVYIFVNNLVITSQGSVNTKKTVIKILEQVNLSKFSKFKLSAEFFLEELVLKYYGDLSEMEKESIITNLDVERDFSSYFWMWKIGKCRERFSSKKIFFFYFVEKESVKRFKIEVDLIHYCFIKAVENHNEMAVEYLWTKYISYNKNSQRVNVELIRKYMLIRKYFNIVMYLLLQVRIDENEMIKFIKNSKSDIHKFFRGIARFLWIRAKVIEIMEIFRNIKVF